MKILLINHNPVVSRLTALSAKKENVELDEIKDITELEAHDYEIIFVDFESYNNETENLLNNSGITKKVLFYTQGDEPSQDNFNDAILKPFLPSEVSAILRETKIELHEKEKQTSTPEEEFADLNDLIKDRQSHIDNLDPKKEEAIEESAEELVDFANEENTTKESDLDTLNFLKQELIAQQTKQASFPESNIQSDANRDEFDLKLKEAFPLNLETELLKEELELDKEVFEIDNHTETSSNELFEMDNHTETSSNELFELDKEFESKNSEDLLDFDLESTDEIDLSQDTPKEEATQQQEYSPEKETKILDANEISNIKELLSDETKTLDEATPPSMFATSQEVSGEEEATLNVPTTKEHSGTTTQVLTETLKTLPIEELRQFLRGAKIHITIEFPNEL